MAEVIALNEKVLPEAFYPTADDININGTSNDKDKIQDTHEAKAVLTISLDNVSKSYKGRNVTMEFSVNKHLPPREKSPDNDGWPQTQNDSNKHSANTFGTTSLQITNVISLASETDEQYINDDCKAEQLNKNQHTKPLVTSFIDKFHRFGRRSTDQLNNDVSKETQNTDLYDMYNLDRMQSVCSEKQTPCFADSNSHMLMTLNEQPKNSFHSHMCPLNSENIYKEQSPSAKLEEDQCSQFDTDQYKNIEFSAIFSSLGDYGNIQDSFDENIPPNEPLHWGQAYRESQNNLIIDLDNQIGVADSCIYDSDSDSYVTLKSDTINVQRYYSEKCTFAMDYEEMFETNKPAKIENRDLDLHNFFYPSQSETMDQNQHYFGHKKWLHPPHSSHLLKRASYPPTTAMNSNSTYNGSIFERSFQEHFPYDHYTSDGFGPYPFEQFYYHPSQENHTVGSSEWNHWANIGNSLPDIYDATKASIQNSEPTSWASPSPSIRNDIMTPEMISFSQQESIDDEETDDADEIDNLTVTFRQSETDIRSSIPLSPRSLTASPMSTSTGTPVSTLSQESQSSEDFSTYCQWPVSLGCINKSSIHGKNFIIPHCKLSTEQLESSLYSYGMEHGVKRPYPSMADVMRRNRLAARSTYVKKLGTDNSETGRRRCGRPRKNQIQSAKITTSTSKISKSKVKASLEEKSCWQQQRYEADVDNGDDYSESGSTNSSRNNRHNEPLNQKAVYIMSKWYEENINNPYPSKADKEEMAQKGGITENQVKSWFANKRNRTNNTKPKVQKRAMEQKLRELFKDLKHNHGNPSADNSHIIQQLSGILQNCHAKKSE